MAGKGDALTARRDAAIRTGSHDAMLATASCSFAITLEDGKPSQPIEPPDLGYQAP